MNECVKDDSLVTLNYRIASSDDDELISTFGSRPATLQLGNGELAPMLERCLAGMPVGERRVFLLEAQQAFGLHHPQLLQRLPRASLPAGEEIKTMTLLEFSAPDGGRYTGLVREIDDQAALIDFNHPLAGKSIRFEVEVIGVL